MQAQRLFEDAQRKHLLGKLTEAQKRYEKILQLEPDHNRARLFLAICYHQNGRLTEALREAQIAMREDCVDPALWTNYGIILKGAGKLRLAEDAYRKALSINPDLHAVKSNLATLLLMRGAEPDAERLFLELTAVLEDPAPWLNLSRIALAREDVELASEYLQKAEDLGPKHPDVPFLRAKLYKLERADEKCFSSLREVLELKPSHADAWQMIQGLSVAASAPDVLEKLTDKLAESGVQDLKTLTSAVDICRRNFLWGSLYQLEELLTASASSDTIVAPGTAAGFTVLGANVPQWAHRKISEANWLKLKSILKYEPIGSALSSIPLGKINVGFLSSDLRSHAVGFLSLGLFEKLPKEKINWFAYSNSFEDATSSRERVRSAFDRFINVAPLSDFELAKKIASDEIHILIDLNGMTRDTRAQVFQFRAAPIQITWLGMPGSLGGGDDCDYVIGDHWTIHDGNRDGFSESAIILPRSYQPNDHVPPDLQLAGSRKDHDLPDECFVFCSFNQHYKFSPDTFVKWVDILQKTEGSVLWLLKPNSESIETRLLEIFEGSGVSPSRIVFAKHVPQNEHIARISHADLILDTLPYNAHTTCSDALRAGVPVITLPGETFAGRVGASILETGNLSDWIVDTPQAYVDKALSYANQSRAEIEAVKQQVRDTYWSSPMVDNAEFARLFEALCLGLYDRHAAGVPAAPLRLTSQGSLEPLPWSEKKAGSVLDGSSVDTSTDADPGNEAAGPEAKDEALNAAPASPSVRSEIKKTGADARLHNLRYLQTEVLGMTIPPLLLDVGAAHFEWDPQSFDALVQDGLFRCLGFEPDQKTFAKLTHNQSMHRRYVDKAVGDGREGKFYLCNGPHMNSMLKPNSPVLVDLMGYKSANVTEVINVQTVRLDDVPEALDAAMIKLDTQGTELNILQHASEVLVSAVVVQLEAAMLPMYEGQPSLFEVGIWLEKRGFVMHSLAKQQLGAYACPSTKYRLNTKSQLLEVDPVFIPSPLRWHELTGDQLKNLAFIMHALYRAHDASQRALWVLDQREGTQIVQAYGNYLKEASFNA